MKKITKAQLNELNNMSNKGVELIKKWENSLKDVEKSLKDLTSKKNGKVNGKDIKNLLAQAVKPMEEIQKVYSELNYKVYSVTE